MSLLNHLSAYNPRRFGDTIIVSKPNLTPLLIRQQKPRLWQVTDAAEISLKLSLAKRPKAMQLAINKSAPEILVGPYASANPNDCFEIYAIATSQKALKREMAEIWHLEKLIKTL